jgi:hypothetical protein
MVIPIDSTSFVTLKDILTDSDTVRKWDNSHLLA